MVLMPGSRTLSAFEVVAGLDEINREFGDPPASSWLAEFDAWVRRLAEAVCHALRHSLAVLARQLEQVALDRGRQEPDERGLDELVSLVLSAPTHAPPPRFGPCPNAKLTRSA